MEPFLISTLAVALAEVGDKTQLLAFLFAARYRKPLPVCLALLVATLANHVLGGAIAFAMTQFMKPDALRWTLGVTLIGLAAWVFSTENSEENEDKPMPLGVFGVALAAFFFAGLGGKAQVATAVLAAQSRAVVEVVFGTTLGAMLTSLPAVILGERFSGRLPALASHWGAAAVFGGLAMLVFQGGGRFGF